MTCCALPRWLGPRLIVVLSVLVALGVHVGVAYADGGEAGLVIQHGDGSVDTYCVPFAGDSISASDMLAKAGIPVVQFSGAVCAVGTQEGCFAPSSFDTCYCMSYPPTSTYWAFYIAPYGKSWQYSALGYQDPRSVLRDGDMQAWRWGKGGPNSAPLPQPITFQQVCGHAPRGGLALDTATATVPPPTAPQATPLPPDALSPAAAPSVTPTAARATDVAGTTTQPALGAATPTSVVRSHGTATAIPQPPATGSSGGGGNAGSLIAFGVLAAALLAAIAGALVWRRRHGA
jgi:hypothetical protein